MMPKSVRTRASSLFLTVVFGFPSGAVAAEQDSPSPASTFYNEALREISAGNLRVGCPKAADAARQDPGFYAAYNLQGVCAVSKGDLPAAEAYFRKSIALNASYLEGRVNLALCLLRQDRWTHGRAELESALRIAPRDPRVLYNLGKAEAATGAVDRAIRRLREAGSLSPRNPEIQLTLAEALVAAERRDEARAVLQGVVRNLSKSEALVRAAAAAFEAEAEDLGDQALQEVLRSHPKATKTALDQARTESDRKHYRAARGLLLGIESSAEGNDGWHALLGYAEYKLGNAADAARHLRRAIELAPLKEERYLDMGEMLLHYNSEQAAVSFFKSGLVRLPKSPLLHYGLAVSYWSHERNPTEAIQELETALSLNPEFAPALALLCRIQYRLKHWDQLEETSDRLIRIDETSPLGYYYKAVARLSAPQGNDDGRAKAGRALLQEAIQLGPKFPEARLAFGKLLEEEGNLRGAILEFEQAVRLDPNNSAGLYHSARAYRETGRLEKSKEALEQFNRLKSERKTYYEGLFQVVH